MQELLLANILYINSHYKLVSHFLSGPGVFWHLPVAICYKGYYYMAETNYAR